MHRNELRLLRIELRELNIEYSALVRSAVCEAGAARMAELRARRRLLMARIAEAAVPQHAWPYAAQGPLDTVVRAA